MKEIGSILDGDVVSLLVSDLIGAFDRCKLMTKRTEKFQDGKVSLKI